MGSSNKVMLLADDRLGALRGQSLTVGNTLVFVPEDGPVETDVLTAEILVKQPGWRYAPAVVRSAADSPEAAAADAQLSKKSTVTGLPLVWTQQKHGRRQQKSNKGGLHER